MELNEIWAKLIDAFRSGEQEFQSVVEEFKRVDPSWLDYLRKKTFSKEKTIAFSVISTLTDDELTSIFDVLIYHASFAHGATKMFRDLIVKLPRSWVLENIEKYAEPILSTADEDVYRRMLELYSELDPQFTNVLLTRALSSDNPAIREAGDDFK